MRSHTLGKNAEKQAERFLKSQGLTLVTRNFHSRFGEIDLIMHSPTHLVFIEVKMRRRTDFGTPEEQVTQKKQQRIIKTALLFLQQNPHLRNKQPRFDVICLHAKKILWTPSAFSSHLSECGLL